MRISLLATFLGLATYILVGLLLLKLASQIHHVSNCCLGLAVFAFILFGASIQYAINPYQIQVDRWSAIYNFIDYLVHGKYPYMAQTHLGGYGSPFPIWQLLHIPFYYLNNVGLSLFVALIFTLYTIKLMYNNKVTICFLMWLLYSPAFIYEILVRSDLITNFLLILTTINFLLIKQIKLSSHYIQYSLLIGLLLSTRLAITIPFFIFLLRPFLALIFQKKIILLLGIILIFCLTFLPFLLWNTNNLLFFEYNPFILQTRQGSILDILLLIPVMVYLALSWKNNRTKLYSNIGYGLFLLTTITFIVNMTTYDNYQLFSSTYDISYLNMSLPFIIIANIKKT